MKRILITLTGLTFFVFSCKKEDAKPAPTAPVVTTAALTNVNISAGSATAGGSIVSDGGATITQSGVVWSKTNNTPTLADTVVAGTIASGTFTSDITGLDFDNTYYFRAFATNSTGTGYGDVVTLTTSGDSVKFTYNGESIVYGVITSPVSGKKWLDRNLGAKRVATAYDDYEAYGDLFQWGRNDDGHQLINWNSSTEGTAVNGTSTELATSDAPGHNKFIVPPYDYPLDWRSDNNRNRWATTPQGPCPGGWHVPSIDEWLAEISQSLGGTAHAGGMTDINSGYSQLKLTAGGTRNVEGPAVVVLLQAGRFGHYWTTIDDVTPEGSVPKYFLVGTEVNPWPDFKASAKSVRCIKD